MRSGRCSGRIFILKKYDKYNIINDKVPSFISDSLGGQAMLKWKSVFAAVISASLITTMVPADIFADTLPEELILPEETTGIQADEEVSSGPEESGSGEVLEEEAPGAADSSEITESADAPQSTETPESADITQSTETPEPKELVLSDLAELDESLQFDLTAALLEDYVSSYSFTSLEDFDKDRYTADLLANNAPENKTLHSFLDEITPVESMAKDMDSDKEFQAGVASWKVLTFNVTEAAEGCLNKGKITEQQYYETVLMDMLQNSMQSDELHKALEEGFSTDLFNNLSTFCSYVEDLDDATLASARNELKSMEIGADSVKAVSTQFAKIFGDTMTIMDGIVGTCKNVYECIEKYTAYKALERFIGTSMGSTLGKMADLCTNNYDMRCAILHVKNFCEDEMSQMLLPYFTAGEGVAKEILILAVDGIVMDAINLAGGSWLVIGQALGKGLANLGYNVDMALEQYFVMSAYAKMMELLRKTVNSAETAFRNNNSSINAHYYLDAVSLYFTGIENGCDYAKEFADSLYEAKAPFFRLSESSYKEFTTHAVNIKTSYQLAHAYVESEMWATYFQSDYPKLYKEYMDLQGTPGGIKTYVNEIDFPNAEVTWRKDSGMHFLTVTVYPEYASNRGVKYTSSNSSVVSVTADGRCTPKNVGSAVITATAIDGSGVSATMNVNVSNDYTRFSDSDNLLQYTITGEEEVSVYALKSAESVIVPQLVKYEGRDYMVTAVASSGFVNAKGKLVNVKLPDTIRIIDAAAFKDCSKLTTINMPAALKTIGYEAFYKCTSLQLPEFPYGLTEIAGYAFFGAHMKQITLRNTLMTIGKCAFSYNDLEEVRIPKSVLSVGEQAFSDCGKLHSVFFEDCYASIGDHCFSQCTELAQVELGSGISSIGKFAFDDCKKLKEIVIPTTVSSMGLDLFCDCEALESISVMTGNPVFSSDGGVLFNKDKTILYRYPLAKTGTSYTVPDTVKELGPQAFEDNKYLEEVSLPDGLQVIWTQAFSTAQSLKRLVIPDSVTKMYIGICEECAALEYVKIPASVTEIPQGAFFYCKALTTVEIPQDNQIERIGEKAFESCSFEKFSFPKNLTSIGIQAFAYNRSLKKAVIPDSVTSIGHRAFMFCEALTTLHLPDGLERLFDSAFSQTAIKEVVIPEGITEIPTSAFSSNKNLTSVTIPSSVKVIGSQAFYNDVNLTKITLTGSAPSIYSKAFYYITDLTVYYPWYDETYKSLVESTYKYDARKLTWAPDPNNRQDISKCSVKLSKTVLTYTGKAQVPKATVSWNGTALTSADYSVTGTNNKNPGIATITIKGKNKLKGSVKMTVQICPKKPKISSASKVSGGVKLQWGRDRTAGGYVIYRNNKAIKTITGNSTVSFVDKGAKKKGTTYTYKIRSFVKPKNSDRIYSAWSAEKKIKV